MFPWNKGKKGIMPSPWNKGLKGDAQIIKDLEYARSIKYKLIQEGKLKSSWNKGLTKETDKRVKINGKNTGKILKKLYAEKKIISYLKNKKFEEIHGEETSKKIKLKIREARAKQIFPLKDSSIEVKIQDYLKQLGYEFFTHQYMNEIEHGYQCDILIPALNLVIECDGDYWHKYPIGRDIDHIRTKELLSKGFKVLRLWEKEIRIMGLEEFKIKIQTIGGLKK